MLRRSLLLAAMARESPRHVALRLAGTYGQSVTGLVYTQTFSLVGRSQLGQTGEVARLLEPYLAGALDGLAQPTPSHYSGHLPLARLKDPRASALVRRAAGMASKKPLDNEMSDSVFMVCPLLAHAGMHDRAAEHFAHGTALPPSRWLVSTLSAGGSRLGPGQCVSAAGAGFDA